MISNITEQIVQSQSMQLHNLQTGGIRHTLQPLMLFPRNTNSPHLKLAFCSLCFTLHNNVLLDGADIGDFVHIVKQKGCNPLLHNGSVS